MFLSRYLLRISKFLCVMTSWNLMKVFFFRGVLIGAEHRDVIDSGLAMVVDIGANRGQFALAVRRWAPQAALVSFEPLPRPARVFRSLFTADSTRVVLHEVAIGPNSQQCEMHLSARDDSSSLLPISELQENIFPGTSEVSTLSVRMGPLENFIKKEDVRAPALLKLDVQGFEYEALRGCESLLPLFGQVYCECSFLELYSGQKLAADVIDWLASRGFRLSGIYNSSYDSFGRAVQADFLFQRG